MSVGTTELITEKIDNLSIDDFLKALIQDSDLTEVVCCLDFIAKETGFAVCLFKDGVKHYPAGD